MPAQLEINDDIAILNLGDDENRFSPEWLAAVNGFLAADHRIREVLLERP